MYGWAFREWDLGCIGGVLGVLGMGGELEKFGEGWGYGVCR